MVGEDSVCATTDVEDTSNNSAESNEVLGKHGVGDEGVEEHACHTQLSPEPHTKRFDKFYMYLYVTPTFVLAAFCIASLKYAIIPGGLTSFVY